MKGYKEDDRPQLFGWADGSYLHHCNECGEGFIGDKRAWMCADCAYKIKKGVEDEQAEG